MLRIWGTALALLLLLLGFLTLSWHGEWKAEAGAERTHALALDVDRLGVSPAIYWFDRPERLVIAGPPWQKAAGQPQQVLVAELRTGRTRWQDAREIDLRAGTSVAWSLPRVPRAISRRAGLTELDSGPVGGTAVAELAFSGFALPRFGYSINVPPFGQPGWRLFPAYFGRLRLAVREGTAGAPAVALARTLVNDPLLPDLRGLATWLPGGEFLLLDPRPYGDFRLLVLGPFVKLPRT